MIRKLKLVLPAVLLLLVAGNSHAAYVNLLSASTTGSSGTCYTFGTNTTVGGCTGYFEQIDPQSTGTGVLKPFVRINGNGDTEQGFNTDAKLPDNDPSHDLVDVVGGTWTHSVPITTLTVLDNPKLSDGSTLTGSFVRFVLDINESNSGGPVADKYLSLDDLRVCIVSSSTANGESLQLNNDVFGGTGANTNSPNCVYRLDGVADNTVLLNYDLNSGSGAGDMSFYVPASILSPYLYTGLTPNWFYLYSHFGGLGDISSSNQTLCPENAKKVDTCDYNESDGFEEWNMDLTGRPIPEPSQFLPLALIAGPLLWRYRRRKQA